MQDLVKKRYLKTWAIANFYMYNIFEIDAGGDTWLQADPLTPGAVCRTAENEKVLKILLENDAQTMNKIKQKVR